LQTALAANTLLPTAKPALPLPKQIIGSPLIKNGISAALQSYVNLTDGNKLRYCASSLCYAQCLNGEKVIRSWICFSPGKRKLYCFACKLLMNLVMNKDFQGVGRPTLTGRMHLEAHLRTKYLHKNALISLTVRAKAGALKQKWVATKI